MLGRNSLPVICVACTLACACLLASDPDSYTAGAQDAAIQRGNELWIQGSFPEAEAAFEDALRLANHDGGDPGKVSVILNGLGSVYQDQGKYVEAERSYRSAILSLEKAHWEENPTLASALHNLAGLYMETSQRRKAEPLLRRSLAIRIAVLGPDHPQVAMTLNSLGALYRSEHNWSKAEDRLKDALSIFERTGKHDLRVAEVMMNLGGLAQDRKRYLEALSYSRDVLSILERSSEAGLSLVAKALNNHGALYAILGKPADAEPYLKRALATEEAALGPDHPAVAGIMSNYASVLRQVKRESEAKDLERQAKAILEKNRLSLPTAFTVDARDLQASAARK